MKLVRILSLAVLTCTATSGLALAQGLRSPSPPAELPPTGYAANQFVDSRGCVYVRVGMGGLANWVPRLTQQRRHICNAQPTDMQAAAASARASGVPEPVQLQPLPDTEETPRTSRSTAASAAPAQTAPAQTAAVQTAAAQTAPQQQAQSQPRQARTAPQQATSAEAQGQAPRGQRVGRPMATIAGNLPDPGAGTASQRQRIGGIAQTGAQTADTASTAAVLRATAQARGPVPSAPGVQGAAQRVASPSARQEGCRWASDASAALMRGDNVRCGPQQGFDRTTRVLTTPAPRAVRHNGIRATEGAMAHMPETTRVVPRHVWIEQQKSADLAPVPAGYRPVWSDDRLNPYRAHQTIAGMRAMDLRWTRDVPRQLIDIRTGDDVTDLLPDLVYPFTDMPTQMAAFAAHGIPMQAVVSSRGAPALRGRSIAPDSLHHAPAPGGDPFAGYAPAFEGGDKDHLLDHLRDLRASAQRTGSRQQGLAVMSSRSVPARAAQARAQAQAQAPSSRAVAVGVDHRFVQVGVFADDAAAQAVVARLAGRGVTPRLGSVSRGGVQYPVVLAGPYSSAQSLGNALYAVRQAGYPGAFTRR